MALLFATSSSATGIQYDLGASDSIKVPVNVSVISQDSAAIRSTGVDTDMTIFGYVGGVSAALQLTIVGSSPDSHRAIRIGNNGILDAGSIGINDFGNGDKIYNYGQIYGHLGIQLSSSAAAADGVIYNYGTIEASLGIKSLSPAVHIYNYGRIDGAEVGAVYTNFGDDLLYNRGTINGLVQLGDGNDRLLNHGLINGDVGLGGGNDTLDNRGGTIDGLIDMGDGNDTLIAGASSETVDGGIGENTLDFSRSSGVHIALDSSIDATGWARDDAYTNFQDLLGSTTGNDILVGDSFDNLIAGFGGNDILSGQGGNDTLQGGRGNDTLDGGTGDDKLSGGDGNDILTGGAGYDILTGGLGADKFLFGEGDIQESAQTAFEKITDFSHVQKDRIDLSAIDANIGADGDQAFVFIGSAQFHNVAGELRFDILQNGALIEGDTNGDGKFDFGLYLAGFTVPVAGDFVL